LLRLSVAQTAFDKLAECLLSSGFGRHPRSDEPGRLVTHMLAVTALQLRDPMLLFVLTESHDASLHGSPVDDGQIENCTC
jgi:hypothetical protein